MQVLTFLLLLGVFGWLLNRFGPESKSKVPQDGPQMAQRITELTERYVRLRKIINVVQSLTELDTKDPEILRQHRQELGEILLVAMAEQTELETKLLELGVSNAVLRSLNK